MTLSLVCADTYDDQLSSKSSQETPLCCRAKRRGALPPVNPETAHLSKNAIQHLKNLKIKKCSEDLVEMGFTQGAYEMARKCGGDQYIAAQHYAEGKLFAAWGLR